MWTRVRQHVFEPIVMGDTLLRWIFWGMITGALVGAAVTGFLDVLFWSIHQSMTWSTVRYAYVLPLGGLITGLLIHYGAPDAAGHGTEAVIRAVHRRDGAINWKVAPIKALATVTTLAAGGSAGKEGPSAQIGSALAALMADLLHFSPENRKRLVICGIGAGFAAVFGTPVAGAILGIEVLAVGEIMYEMLVPSFAASIVAFEVSKMLGMHWNYGKIAHAIPFSGGTFLKVLILGILAGLAAYLLILAMDVLHHLKQRLENSYRVWPPVFPMVAGIMLFVMVLIAGRSYMNLSLGLLYHSLDGHAVGPDVFLWKIAFVAVTLGFGMSGGIITPLFVIGSTLGAAVAGLLHLPIGASAEIGMIAVTAGGANVPIAGIIMGMEIFGPGLSVYFLAAAIPAYMMVGNHSVYPSQRLAVEKSPHARVRIGRYLEDQGPPDLRWDQRQGADAKTSSADRGSV